MAYIDESKIRRPLQLDRLTDLEGDDALVIEERATNRLKHIEADDFKAWTGVDAFDGRMTSAEGRLDDAEDDIDGLEARAYPLPITESFTGVVFDDNENEIYCEGIVTALGLEVGDVIQFMGTDYNDKLHTVEGVIDSDNIIVNYEHSDSRGKGPLMLTNETADCTIRRIAKWYNAPTGVGQAWVDVNSLVVVNSSRTNSTNRPIGLSIVHNNNGGTQTNITIDELLRANNQSSVVMSQDYYVFNASWKTSKALNYCWEMR